MGTLETRDIRNVALVGHGGAGKTLLVEAMLHEAGQISRIGSVTDGTTTSDFNPDEKAKQHSIDAALTYLTQGDTHLNLIDTPGYPDHLGAAIGALCAVETAVVVINAGHGIEVNTRRLWRDAGEAGLARVVVLARMDSENVSAEKLLQQVQEQFGPCCLPFNLPVGEAASFSGVESAFTLPDNPNDVIGDLQKAHDKLLEAAVEADDDVMEKYLETGSVDPADLAAVTAKAIVSGRVVPVLFCSTVKGIGVKPLIDLLAGFAPSPIEGKRREAARAEADPEPIEPTAEGPLYSQVFKMVTDPFVGKLSFLRVFGGTLNADKPIYNQRAEKMEKIGGMFRLQGKEQKAVTQAVAGDIIALAKLDDVQISDTFTLDDDAGALAPIRFPEPMVSLAVDPKSQKDEQKITSALAKLKDEDATFGVRIDSETHELVVTGMSDLHLETLLARLKSRFEVEVTPSLPKVAYKESLSKPAQAMYKHKKQTGGRGQFAEVWLKVEPLERGAGFDFANEVVGGSIPGQYLPAVEKGIHEAMTQGVIAGYEFIDVRVRVYDGKFHPVDSSEAAFKMAGSKAFRAAIMDAHPVLLEPIVEIEVTLPNRFMGDITGDLNSRRGHIIGVDSVGNDQVIQAQIPLAEVMIYSTQLRSMTGGEASFTMKYARLDVVPSKIADSIKSKFKGHDDEE